MQNWVSAFISKRYAKCQKNKILAKCIDIITTKVYNVIKGGGCHVRWYKAKCVWEH